MTQWGSFIVHETSYIIQGCDFSIVINILHVPIHILCSALSRTSIWGRYCTYYTVPGFKSWVFLVHGRRLTLDIYPVPFLIKKLIIWEKVVFGLFSKTKISDFVLSYFTLLVILFKSIIRLDMSRKLAQNLQVPDFSFLSYSRKMNSKGMQPIQNQSLSLATEFGT